MEPITLCGLLIVTLGLWVELESIAKTLARAVCSTKILKRIVATATVQQRPVYVNRYVPYPPG